MYCAQEDAHNDSTVLTFNRPDLVYIRTATNWLQYSTINVQAYVHQEFSLESQLGSKATKWQGSISSTDIHLKRK